METSALSFARPALLHALWLLPLGVALFWWAERRRRALIGRIVAPKLRALLAGNTSPARRRFRAACILGSLGCLVVTMAGPRIGYDTLEVPHRGRDVIIAMDVSRSMLATDVAPTRLQRAKLLAEDLIGELGGDRLGLVAFAGSAFLQAPLTLDHGAVLAAVDEMDTELIPKGGTNLAAAIRTCEEAFGKAEGFSRAIVIISDGEELDADGLEAARQAAADGIRIFTVGVGSEEGSEIPLGPGEFVRDPSGKIVQSRLDAARMQEIAETTGGFYLPLTDAAARRLAVDGIGQMKEAEMSASTSRQPIERFQWPLAAAIGLLVLQALVGERRRRSAMAAAAIWLLSSGPAWSAPAGLAAYEQEDYQAARKAFEERLKMEPDSPALQLNAGTAAYRLEEYGKASEYFSRAMLSEDPALRSAAEFNLGNTLFRQGEGREDKEKKITDWKDAIAKYEAALKTRPDYIEAKENKEKVEELLKQLEQEQPQQDQKQDQQQQQDRQQKQDQQQQQGGGQQDQQQKDQQKKEDQKDRGQQQKDRSQGGQDQKDQQQQGEQDSQEPSADGGEKERQQQKSGDKKEEPQQSGGQGRKQDGEQGREQSDQGKSGRPENEKEKEGKQDEPPEDGEGQKGDEPQQRKGEGDEGREPKDADGSSGQPRSESGESGDQPAPVPRQPGGKKEGELRAAGGEGGEEENAAAAAAAAAEEEVEGQMSAAQARALLRSLQSEEEQVDLRERRNFQDVSRDW